MATATERPEPEVSVAKILVILAALISLFVDQSFAGAFNVIVNYVGGSLGASADETPWISIGYNSLYDVFLLLTPWLISRFGRRTVFGSGHLVFAAITAYLAVTVSLHGFMIARCLQGLAQGTFFVCSVITVLTVPPPKLRGYAFAIFSVTSLSGAALGPFLGGWFLDHGDWHGLLALYAGATAFSAVIISLLLVAPEAAHPPRFDLPGVCFAFPAFFGLQYCLAFGERRDWLWSGDIVAFALLFVVGFAGFIWRELCENRCGFIQLRLFSIRNLAVGSLLGFGLGIPLFGANLFLQYAQGTLSFPPSTAGALLTLRILAIAFVAPTVVVLVNADKLDVRVPVFVGFLLVSLSYGLLALQTTGVSEFESFAGALIISGAGFACLFSPIANALVRSLPEEVRAEGIAIFKLVLVLGGTIASTGLAVAYDHAYAAYETLLAGEATLRHFVQIGHGQPGANALEAVAAQARVLAYADNSKLIALACLANLPLLFFLRKPQPVKPQSQPATAG